MALSFSRPDVTSPASVAEATFPTARRGYDTGEVRELLRAVAAELGRLQERERFLERELRVAREAQSQPQELDDETVSRLLGEETLRVLQTARESASQIKIKAEEGAARIVREATEEANRLRAEAEVEAARRRSDAAADAEAEVSLAKQQGREMVNEARAYRERVLSELARRREAARQQIEQLVQGRDRLLQAFDRARLVAIDVVAELTPLGEPDEYVNLAPTTGPVPLMVPNRPAPAEEASAAEEPFAVEEPVAEEQIVEEQIVEEPVAVEDAAVEVEAPVAVEDTVPVEAPVPVEEPVAVEDTVPVEEPVPVEDTVPVEEPAPAVAEHTNVVELFARLRAETASEPLVETGSGASEEASVEPTSEAPAERSSIFARRDEALVPLIVAAARKMKRVLADEQNGALDTLRRREPVTDVSSLVPDVDTHVTRYAEAITTELTAAAAAGAQSIDVAAGTPDVGAVRDVLRDDLVVPLRERLAACVADGDGDNDDITRAVRAVYREWKTQHIDDQLDDVFRLAYGIGALHALEPGTPVCWMVDPDGPACPDAEDNALAGAVPAGEPFPTGHRSAPAHAGCRCLLAPTRQ